MLAEVKSGAGEEAVVVPRADSEARQERWSALSQHTALISCLLASLMVVS